jgi:tRNA dimethylallyltransferase
MTYVILGPTGIGKTSLAVEIAEYLDCPIISCDAFQIYKDMDIGTGKIMPNEKGFARHYLINKITPEETYSVKEYQSDFRNIYDKLIKTNKNVVIVGGTGLYIKAALYDYKFDTESNFESYDGYSTEDLYEMLKKIDPNTDIHPNNRKRIIRSLNYFNNTKKPLSTKEKTDKLLYDVIFIGLTTNRDILYDRINKRVDVMLKDGLLDEAKRIYKSNIRTKAIMTPIGYKELFPYFENKISLEEALDKIRQDSRRYAKRQYTWNNHQIDVNWFDVDFNNFDNTVNDVINFINK